jgi:hypothetical protein
MADFTVTGFINTVKYLPGAALVFIDEFKRGYKKSNGETVDDKYLSWKCIFKPYFKKYINEHFSNGMLVQVKGEILPYAIQNQNIVDGYSVLGQTINLASFPRASVKQENKMIKESQMHDTATPNLDEYNKPDF